MGTRGTLPNAGLIAILVAFTLAGAGGLAAAPAVPAGQPVAVAPAALAAPAHPASTLRGVDPRRQSGAPPANSPTRLASPAAAASSEPLATEPVQPPRWVAGFRDEQTGLQLPGRFGGLVLRDVERFDDRDAGVAARYGGPNNTKVDVIIYPTLVASVAEGIDSQLLKDQFAGAMGAIFQLEKMGRLREVELLSQGTVTVGRGQPGERRFRHARFRYRQLRQPGVDDESPRLSHLYLAIWRGHYLKVRGTWMEAADAAAGPRVEALVGALAALLH